MMSKLLTAKKLYLDANIFIYLFERQDELGEKAASLFDHTVLSDTPVFINEIGVAECLYGAFRLGSPALEKEYKEFFYEVSPVTLVPVDGSTLIAAAKLGAEKRLKLVDAVHFHTAIQAECDILVTNDHRFHSSHGLTVVQLGQL
jgi:predicted nucleic acid-binding protein